MQLTYDQKRSFIECGSVTIPGVVPRVMVEKALRAINHAIGQGMNVEDMPVFRSQSYCPGIRDAPAITNLVNRTPIWALAESAIGPDRVQPVTGGQIAIRFPVLDDPPPRPHGHLDGMYSKNNGVPEGTIRNYTMLAVVLLSDLPAPYMGNFTTWPGTHHRFEAYFREHGPESLLKGMPKIRYPEPQQITGRAGDVVFSHYMIAHGAAPNVSAYPRYAVIFRLKARDHDAHMLETMTDIWREWPGIRDVLGEKV